MATWLMKVVEVHAADLGPWIVTGWGDCSRSGCCRRGRRSQWTVDPAAPRPGAETQTFTALVIERDSPAASRPRAASWARHPRGRRRGAGDVRLSPARRRRAVVPGQPPDPRRRRPGRAARDRQLLDGGTLPPRDPRSNPRRSPHRPRVRVRPRPSRGGPWPGSSPRDCRAQNSACRRLLRARRCVSGPGSRQPSGQQRLVHDVRTRQHSRSDDGRARHASRRQAVPRLTAGLGGEARAPLTAPAVPWRASPVGPGPGAVRRARAVPRGGAAR